MYRKVIVFLLTILVVIIIAGCLKPSGVDRDRIPGINGQLSVVVIPAKACGSASDHVTVPVKAISVIDQSKIRLPLLVES